MSIHSETLWLLVTLSRDHGLNGVGTNACAHDASRVDLLILHHFTLFVVGVCHWVI